MPKWIALDQATDASRCGEKAAWLARASAAGLPVPRGIVLPAGSASDIDDATLVHACGELGDCLAVRSSATVENLPSAAAAGIFVTRLDVRAENVPSAVREVRASAASPLAAAYLTRRGIPVENVGMAVLIQPMVSRLRFGFMASGAPPVVEAYDAWSSIPSEAAIDHDLLRRVEAVAGGSVEIEWVYDGVRTWLMQLRRSHPTLVAPFPVTFATATDAQALWRWDSEHNPAPVSPAHADLIATLDQPIRVFSGYLYVAAESAVPTSPIPPEDLYKAWSQEIAPSLDTELQSLVARAQATPEPAAALDDTLAGFRRFAGRYGAVSEALARTRTRLREACQPFLDPRAAESICMALAARPTWTVERDQDLFGLAQAARLVPGLVEHLSQPGRPAPRTAELADWFAALRTHLDTYGAMPPIWDLCSPPYAEDPRPLYPLLVAFAANAGPSPAERRAHAAAHAAEARRTLISRAPADRRAALERVLAMGAANLPIAEDDDIWFAKALRTVRTALLAIGRRLATRAALARAEDVFFLPLELARDPHRHADLRTLVEAARAEHLRQRSLVPPAWIRGDQQHFARSEGETLVGIGMGGRARGRVCLARSLNQASAALDSNDRVLVVPTILPQMTFLLARAAAVVADHGGRLDHGAVHAREYGLAAVVGTRHATRWLRDGDEVLVDGVEGRVVKL